jgi:hypothetical protein
MMNSEVRNKWQIRAATLSIFLLGAMAGAFALNAYYLWFDNEPRQLTREQRFQKIVTDLKLDDSQKSEVQQIFNDARENVQALHKEGEPKMNSIREQADGRLQKIMSPEQWQKFIQMREQRKEEDNKQRESRDR